MEAKFSTTKTRTLVPIAIDVHDVAAKPQILVEPLGEDSTIDTFELPVQEQNGFYHSEFWLEQEGNYKVSIVHGEQTFSQILQITPQEFLSFSFEFGIFFISLIIGFLGLIVWHRKKIK